MQASHMPWSGLALRRRPPLRPGFPSRLEPEWELLDGHSAPPKRSKRGRNEPSNSWEPPKTTDHVTKRCNGENSLAYFPATNLRHTGGKRPPPAAYSLYICERIGISSTFFNSTCR